MAVVLGGGGGGSRKNGRGFGRGRGWEPQEWPWFYVGREVIG